jgi:hypothetical protein
MGLGSLVCGLLISIIYLMDFLYLQRGLESRPWREILYIIGARQPRPRPLLGWLWQVSLAGLVNFRLAFGNYHNGHLPRKGLVDFTSSQISPITL